MTEMTDTGHDEDIEHEEQETDAEPVQLTDEEIFEALPGLDEFIEDDDA